MPGSPGLAAGMSPPWWLQLVSPSPNPSLFWGTGRLQCSPCIALGIIAQLERWEQKDAPDPFPIRFYSKVLLKSRAVAELPGWDRGCGPAHGVLQGPGSPLPARCIPPPVPPASSSPRRGRGWAGEGWGEGLVLAGCCLSSLLFFRACSSPH